MAVNTITNVYILREHVMSSSFRAQTAVIQYTPSSLSVDMFSTGHHQDVKADMQVKGIYTTKVSSDVSPILFFRCGTGAQWINTVEFKFQIGLTSVGEFNCCQSALISMSHSRPCQNVWYYEAISEFGD